MATRTVDYVGSYTMIQHMRVMEQAGWDVRHIMQTAQDTLWLVVYWRDTEGGTWVGDIPKIGG